MWQWQCDRDVDENWQCCLCNCMKLGVLFSPTFHPLSMAWAQSVHSRCRTPSSRCLINIRIFTLVRTQNTSEMNKQSFDVNVYFIIWARRQRPGSCSWPLLAGLLCVLMESALFLSPPQLSPASTSGTVQNGLILISTRDTVRRD